MRDGSKITLMLQVDPNTGVAMYESDAIITYLAKTYGLYSFVYFTIHTFPALQAYF
jgi:glutathione S-transferase